MKQMQSHHYRSGGGIDIYRASYRVDAGQAVAELGRALDSQAGVLFSSSCDYPGRHTRWDIGFSAPPLRISASGLTLRCSALNARGTVLLRMLHGAFEGRGDFEELSLQAHCLELRVRAADAVRFEEERTRQRSIFTALRAILGLFASPEDDFLGLYGAFGYELAFQFDTVRPRLARRGDSRDLVLYLPDSILVVDHRKELAQQHVYDFTFGGGETAISTRDLPRRVREHDFEPAPGAPEPRCDHEPGAYAAVVRKALAAMRAGELFEVVPSQSFSQPCRERPSTIHRRLARDNPSPYGALLNLGHEEYLVAASPEMFVRVRGREVETSPISGTIARGADALEDAEQIRRLLNSAKDEAELSMCTDVDRNDKSRVCVPGSVRVTGRRLIELYSRLIHTADHVRGTLKPGFDALDAFLSHAWAVTVTGAPKQAAIQFIEDHERAPRHWYGGAIGYLGFNGDLNTGITIRTVRIREGRAEVRAGATLLADSDPEAEEAETRLKAAALLQALRGDGAEQGPPSLELVAPARTPRRILMVDHRDSFVHTLASYLQQRGAELRTVRPEFLPRALDEFDPALVVLSPGPGRPDDFAMRRSIDAVLRRGIPLFGVCLGLQGLVEYFGGTLRLLAEPVHGKSSTLAQQSGPLFAGLAPGLRVGRYHSLVADRMPAELEVRARSGDGEVMAVQHRDLPLAAVQFHPESILSAGGAGAGLIGNVLDWAVAVRAGDGRSERDTGGSSAVSSREAPAASPRRRGTAR